MWTQPHASHAPAANDELHAAAEPKFSGFHLYRLIFYHVNSLKHRSMLDSPPCMYDRSDAPYPWPVAQAVAHSRHLMLTRVQYHLHPFRQTCWRNRGKHSVHICPATVAAPCSCHESGLLKHMLANNHALTQSYIVLQNAVIMLEISCWCSEGFPYAALPLPACLSRLA